MERASLASGWEMDVKAMFSFCSSVLYFKNYLMATIITLNCRIFKRRTSQLSSHQQKEIPIQFSLSKSIEVELYRLCIVPALI